MNIRGAMVRGALEFMLWPKAGGGSTIDEMARSLGG